MHKTFSSSMTIFFPFLFFVDVATLLFCLCGIKDVPTKVDDAIIKKNYS